MDEKKAKAIIDQINTDDGVGMGHAMICFNDGAKHIAPTWSFIFENPGYFKYTEVRGTGQIKAYYANITDIRDYSKEV